MLLNRIATSRKDLVPIRRTVTFVSLLLCIGLGVFHYFGRKKFSETTARRNAGRRLSGEHDGGEYDYDSIYSSNGAHETYKNLRTLNFSSLGAYGSPDVSKHGCNLTSILMEPRLPGLDFRDAAWYTLESLATYAPYTCLLIQTSSCDFLSPSEPMPRQIEVVAEKIYSHALPMFRQMMERGLVRITILDYQKYNLPSCTNFHTPTNAWMNFHYWNDELIHKVDSDILLTIQTDGVICRHFNYKLWSDLAYVGAPWAPTPTPTPHHNVLESRWYGKDVCEELRGNFKDWTANELGPIMKPIPANQEGIQDLLIEWRRNQPPPLNLDKFCSPGYSPGFNGGISLRNKTWLLRAIDACPHEKLSGIPVSGRTCVVRQEAIEDEYFSIILHALGAPMPTAYEAALFAVETFFAEQAREYYGPYSHKQIVSFLIKRWGKNGMKRYVKMHLRKTYNYTFQYDDNDLASSTLRTIPMTLHKPWQFQPKDIINGKQVTHECKFLRFIERS